MVELRLFALAAAAFCVAAPFLAIGLKGNIAFVLELRLLKLAALIQVGVAIAVSTVNFQTVTENRILTPSIMGLDALYLFGQMVLVFLLGAVGFVTLDPQLKFGIEVLLLMGLACALLLPLLRSRLDMGLMLLAGVVFGVLFRSLQSLLARLIDPNDFAVVQSASFANFNTVRTDLLAFAAIATLIAMIIAWRARHVLDVISLGPDVATGLGVNWSGTVTGLLMLVSSLVAVSTALVGPAALTGIVVLAGGQTLFQHVLCNATALGIVIEFVGGLIFLLLLVLGSSK